VSAVALAMMDGQAAAPGMAGGRLGLGIDALKTGFITSGKHS